MFDSVLDSYCGYFRFHTKPFATRTPLSEQKMCVNFNSTCLWVFPRLVYLQFHWVRCVQLTQSIFGIDRPAYFLITKRTTDYVHITRSCHRLTRDFNQSDSIFSIRDERDRLSCSAARSSSFFVVSDTRKPMCAVLSISPNKAHQAVRVNNVQHKFTNVKHKILS